MVFFNLESYKNYIKFSTHKHILVEGKDDKIFFKNFIDEISNNKSINDYSDVIIDKAENFRGFDEAIGNREKVELVSETINSLNLDRKFVGFVDREFRKFELNEKISDPLNKHLMLNSLIWSLGHSIENYLFRLDVLRIGLRSSLSSEYFTEAFTIFKDNYNQVMQISCVIGILTKFRSKNWKRMVSGLEMEIIELNTGKITINQEKWKDKLMERQISDDEITIVFNDYKTWFERVKTLDIDLVSLICHGHIGIIFIKYAFAKCLLFELESNQMTTKEAKKILHSSFLDKAEEDLFINFSNEYIRIAINENLEFPKIIFNQIN